MSASVLMVSLMHISRGQRTHRWSLDMLARDKGLTGLILPRENAPEAAVVEEIEVIGIGTLAEAVGFLTSQLPLEPTVIDINAVFANASRYEEDFSEVRGQESVKRAVTVAASGGQAPGTPLTEATTRRYGPDLSFLTLSDCSFVPLVLRLGAARAPAEPAFCRDESPNQSLIRVRFPNPG